MKKTFLFVGLFIINCENLFAQVSTHQALNQAAEHMLPNPIMILPFVLLLAMIATGPLFYKHFWEKNYPAVFLILFRNRLYKFYD